MKKFLFATMIAAAAGMVMAQDMVVLDEQPAAEVAVVGDLGFYSAHVWRGQVLNDGPVVQPSLTVSKGGFSLNIWGNYNIDGKDGNNDDDFDRIDFSLAYSVPMTTDDFSVDVGLIKYTFPGSGNVDDDTEELFIKSTFHHIILTPVVSFYYDINAASSYYALLALSQGFEVSDAMTMEIGASAGLGGREYNDYYFNSEKSGGNDYNVYLSAEYALAENLSLGALVQYTVLDGSVGNDVEAGTTPVASGTDNTVWGGLSLSYTF